MMNRVSLKQWLAVVGCAAAALGSQSVLAGQTWKVDNLADAAPANTNASGCTKSGGGLGNSISCTGAVTATMQGWGTTVQNSPSSTYAAAYLSNQGSSGIGLTSSEPAASGGLESNVDPNHMIDSIGNSELISIKFGAVTTLKSVTLGLTGTDADFTVLAWLGAGDPTTSIAGKTAGNVATGWTLVQQVTTATANLATPQSININAGNVSSSYWIIAAFNSTLGGPGTLDNIGDSWKLLSVSNVAAAVPEPGSLALVALALLGMRTVRRSNGAMAVA